MSKSSDAVDSWDDSTNDELAIGFWNKKATKKENSESSVPIRKVYVTNVHGSTKHAELKEFFSKFGTVVEANVRSGRKTTRRHQYFAFVTFDKAEAAAKAIAARRSQLKLRDRVLNVSRANIKHQPDKPDNLKPKAKHKFQTYVNRKSDLEDYEKEDCAYREKKRKCKINDLNDDCLSLIFSYFEIKEKISVLELVCKRWRVVLLDQWMRVTHLNLQNHKNIENLDDNMLGVMLQRCGMSLLKLELPITHKLSGDAFHVIASLCRNLEHLSAHAVRVTVSAVNQLTMKCRHLKVLILREPISIRDRDIQILFEKLQLETFALTQRSIDGLCLSNLPHSLKHLDLTSCRELIMSSLLSGLSRTTNLQSLVLDDCANLTETDFQSVCSKIPQIQELSVAEYFPNLKGPALDSIQYLKNLRKLNISLNALVDDRLVSTISICCNKLEVLNISGCRGASLTRSVSDSGIEAIALKSNVTNLSMSYLSDVTDESFFALAEAGKIKQLHCLGCPELTDSGCSRLISLCLELELLDVSGCKKITSETTNTAVETQSLRPDAKKLHLIVGGTSVMENEIPVPNRYLEVDMTDNCVYRLCPDFSHDSFYASGEDDDYGFDCDSEDYDPFDPYPFEFDSEDGYSDSELQQWQ